jgi:hypothetical protein
VSRDAAFVTPPAPPGLRPGSPPRFSVLVPLYNGAATVADAVGSALAQTTPPAEVIVCDDGSTDSPEETLRGFGNRITLLRQPNRGAPVAQNLAMSAATGDFVAVLDADDVWEPARLERLCALAVARSDLDILGTDLLFERAGRVVGRFGESNAFPRVNQDLAILWSCFLSNPALRRERVEALGGFDPWLPVAYDWDILLRLILDGSRAGLVEEPLARYRLHDSGLTGARARSLRYRAICLEKIARSDRLTPAQREVLRRSLAMHRLRAVQAETAGQSGGASPRSRRRLLRCALAAGVPLAMRWRAAAVAVTPRAWQRRLPGAGAGLP